MTRRPDKRDSANDRTVTLTDEALEKYKTWGHRKSEHTSKAILAYEPNQNESPLVDLFNRMFEESFNNKAKNDNVTKSEVEEILKPIIERIKALEERKGKK